MAKDILVEKGILRDPTKPTVLLDQFTGTKPVDNIKRSASNVPDFNDALSLGNFSADFNNKNNNANGLRQFSSVSDGMVAEMFGILNELRSKVDILSGGDQSHRLNKTKSPTSAAAPGPHGIAKELEVGYQETFGKTGKNKILELENEEDVDSDYKDDFESTFKNSENALTMHLESSE